MGLWAVLSTEEGFVSPETSLVDTIEVLSVGEYPLVCNDDAIKSLFL